MKFYHAAVKLADAMIARFYDHTGGAFYDAAAPAPGEIPLGALGARRKPLQDSPTPAGNPTAASALLRLEQLNGRAGYRDIAEDTLASFAGIVAHLGLYVGSYGLALERLLSDPVEVVISGSGPEADRLEAVAVSGFNVAKVVMRWIAPDSGEYPELVGQTMLNLPLGRPGPFALVCRGRTCAPAVSTSDALLEAMRQST
jgi:hypothetical protein